MDMPHSGDPDLQPETRHCDEEIKRASYYCRQDWGKPLDILCGKQRTVIPGRLLFQENTKSPMMKRKLHP
jgi:hypothetical protein